MAAAPPPDEAVALGISSADDDDAVASREDSMADDDSLDAYGEDDDMVQDTMMEPDNGNDEYARTFDSPVAHEAEAPEEGAGPRQDVPEQPESKKASIPASDSPVPPAQPAEPHAGDELSPSLSVSSDDTSASSSPLEHPPQPSDQALPANSEAAAAAAAAAHAAHTAAVPNHASQPPARPAEAQAEHARDLASVPNDAGDAAGAIDIQKLVDDITARATASSADTTAASAAPGPTPAAPSPEQAATEPPVSPQIARPAHSFLPPKPPLPAQDPTSNALHTQDASLTSPAGARHAAAAAAAPLTSPTLDISSAPMPMPTDQGPAYAAAGAPGTSHDAIHSLPPPPSSTMQAAQAPGQFPSPQLFSPSASMYPPQQHFPPYNVQEAFDAFLADERRYVAEAKWDRFPDGSRLFIGNLSQEKVSKRDVFDLFHSFGRLAQISLKSAYGFVQYHNVAEAQAAMQHLQGADVRGRKIHLEFTHTQKDKKRDRSSERNKNRGGGRNTDRYDGREQGRNRGRDDYRPGNARESPPRRDDHRGRDDSYRRDRGHFDSHGRRNRSRSPTGYNNNNNNNNTNYRSRRSPSPPPYGRAQADSQSFDLPRRHGSDVPDIQLLVMQDVNRDFIQWVQRAFSDQGLKTDVMYINPQSIPRDAVIQRQALEGVLAVIDLDYASQSTATLRLQLFDRSGGGTNIRFDIYADLSPQVAAGLVLRKKQSASHPPAYAPPQANYGQGYPATAAAPQHPYQQHPQGLLPQQQQQQQHHHHHHHQQQQQQQQQQQPALSAADLSSLVNQVDNATLQILLASLQPQAAQPSAAYPTAAPPAAAAPIPYAQQAGPPAGAPGAVDIQAMLGNLNKAAGLSASYGGAGYAAPAPNPTQSLGALDPQVQSLIAQFSRNRQ